VYKGCTRYKFSVVKGDQHWQLAGSLATYRTLQGEGIETRYKIQIVIIIVIFHLASSSSSRHRVIDHRVLMHFLKSENKRTLRSYDRSAFRLKWIFA